MKPSPLPQIAPGPSRLTSQEVCALLRISRATLWRRIKRGELPSPVDRGRQALFQASAIHAVVNGSGCTRDEELSRALEARLAALTHRRRSFP